MLHKKWFIAYISEGGKYCDDIKSQAGITEANARAKTLIYLKENKLI